ncbi:MAG TPA: 3-deoxy-manno-octulosonate cytidylyltransferase [Pseudomonadales bacterium]|nr:3-deoxy-manno-octulosonate cytidylyltransferase [Pseudomonadales bacterium]
MKFSVVIPARYASTRLPGKPLQDIAGKPMVQHVYEQALKSSATEVVIATDDTRIVAAVQAFGGRVVMTSDQHESGTDRLQEVAALMGWADDHVVVNVQGDEPLIPPQVIDQVAALINSNGEADVATLCEAIHRYEDVINPAVVKVVANQHQRALYFSRAPIPWDRDAFAADQHVLVANQYWRHIGIYAYRVATLNAFVSWPVAAIERIEKLEQLRVMANGGSIAVAETCCAIPGGVDTPADLVRVRTFIAGGHTA